MVKKRVANGVVHNAVVDALLVDRELAAPEIKRIVEKELKQKGYNYHFTVRTYLNLKKEILPNLGTGLIDSPWTIGACVKYNFPPEYIAMLLNEQKIVNESEHRVLLTIREALWFTKLYTFVHELALKEYPDNVRLQTGAAVALARQYAHRERVAEILAKGTPNATPDTSDIDKHLMAGDISQAVLADAIMEYSFSDKMKKDIKKMTEEYKPYSQNDFEAISGMNISVEQTVLLNEWLSCSLRSSVYKRDWEKQHPEINDLVVKMGCDPNDLVSSSTAIRLTLELYRKQSQKDGE